MPGVPDPRNLYSETTAGKLSAAVAGHLERIYVPNHGDNTVSVIDPATLQVVDRFRVGVNPQHVVPSWNLQVLWVANNAEGRTDGSLTPIDPRTGKPGPSVPVDDPYNMYWSPDGRYAIVVAEAYKRLDFRDPATMRLVYSIETPDCAGINHADFSIDGTHALFTCEFDGGLTKVDLVNRRVVATIKLSRYFDRPDVLAILQQPGRKPRRMIDPAVPRSVIVGHADAQDELAGRSPFRRGHGLGWRARGGLATFRRVGFIPTGVGTPSRDGTKLYVSTAATVRTPTRRGSVSVIEFASERIVADWASPGSPDMGNVSADGRYLWLSGRYDQRSTASTPPTAAPRAREGSAQPHGLTVWPQRGATAWGTPASALTTGWPGACFMIWSCFVLAPPRTRPRSATGTCAPSSRRLAGACRHGAVVVHDQTITGGTRLFGASVAAGSGGMVHGSGRGYVAATKASRSRSDAMRRRAGPRPPRRRLPSRAGTMVPRVARLGARSARTSSATGAPASSMARAQWP
jgi:YVTN family beta-propeller protein